MSDASAPPSPPDDRPPSERRRNVALRELIDEMMDSIRVATNRDLWSTEERTQYERELATIMTRVRGAAVPQSDGDSPAA
jgi:hypothetical protein